MYAGKGGRQRGESDRGEGRESTGKGESAEKKRGERVRAEGREGEGCECTHYATADGQRYTQKEGAYIRTKELGKENHFVVFNFLRFYALFLPAVLEIPRWPLSFLDVLFILGYPAVL